MKLENNNVQALLMNYELVALNEVKTSERIYLPGYACYRNSTKEGSHRGGTVLLVKRSLLRSVVKVDVKVKDQIWVKFSLLNNILLGFIYIPPSDSQYFNPNSFSNTQEQILNAEKDNRGVVIKVT